MKIKNLFLSTILILSTSFTSILFFNKIDNQNNKIINKKLENYSDDPNVKPNLTAKLSDTFCGFVFHIISPEIVGYHITEVILYLDQDGTTINSNIKNLRFLKNTFKQNNIKSIDSDLNFAIGINNQNSFINNEQFINSWNIYLNLNTIFNSPIINYMHGNSEKWFTYFFDGYDEYFQCYVIYELNNSDLSYDFGSNYSNSLNLSNSNSTNYDRASLDNISYSYINDELDPNYGWFKCEIILDNKYTDIIKEDSVKFYYFNDEQKEVEYNPSNFILNFDYTNNSYQFYLKPYLNNKPNIFKISFNIEYSLIIPPNKTLDEINISEYFTLNYPSKLPKQILFSFLIITIILIIILVIVILIKRKNFKNKENKSKFI